MPNLVQVVDATNSNPIVVRTSAPHGLTRNDAATIAGVLGNTAANGTFQTSPVDATHFSVVPVSGTTPALYTGGGTVVGPLGGLLAVARLLSTELRQELVLRGIPALQPNGEILLGAEYVFQNDAPNRIVLVPDESDFGPPGGFAGMGGVAAGGRTAVLASQERKVQLADHSRMEEKMHLAVWVWGLEHSQPDPANPDPAFDFDATRDLYHAFLTVLHRTTVGNFTVTKGKWAQSNPKSQTMHVSTGRAMTFGIEFATPVRDRPVAFAPAGTKPSLTASVEAYGTPPEQGFPTP